MLKKIPRGIESSFTETKVLERKQVESQEEVDEQVLDMHSNSVDENKNSYIENKKELVFLSGRGSEAAGALYPVCLMI